ncbi:hypothetical protein KVR01_008043 [Diaporthe batatas]|uniref:uncharacterized protein n=1 Tax=Diaporthe batatas TaxID=748121 RepID=UPI001D046BA1|nr:uncharacterized protein KVR01_008043 [Diaporthe batatas]KAG8162278.1 hypothetical protein KVR01_008043 [Diaporthe batatas]
MDPETRQRIVTLRNIQGDLAVLFGDYRNGVKRLYPDVVLQRIAAEMRGEGATFAEKNRPVRRGWPWNGLPSQSNLQMVRLQAQNWKRFWRQRFLPEQLDDDIPAQLGAGRVRRLLRSKGINARLVKVLGSGGQGMVSLWEINTMRGWKRVVIKSTALEGAVLQREKATTLAMKRARHLVQLLRFNGDIMIPKGDGSDETESIAQWEEADNSLEIMCIEYMKNGDMLGFMTRVGSAGIPVPNRVLWKIFICRKWVEPPGTEGQEGLMPGVTEEAQRLLAYNLVHFDLDPQNVMIGDFDNDEHAEVPIFKCMHMLITQASWPNPPKAVGPLNDDVAMADLFPTHFVFRVTDFDGNLVNPFHTYGAWLANPSVVESERPLDNNLASILVRCLAADPADRPSLRELLRWARWRETQPDWRVGQDEIRAWVDEHISQPPAAPVRAPASLQTGLAAIGPDVMDRLTEAAGMLRISGMATVADKAERLAPRRVAPVDDLRQIYQDQEGSDRPPGIKQAPFGWMATMVQSRLAQLQNLLNIGRLPSTANQTPTRPLRRRDGVDDLRAGFRQGSLRRRERTDDLRAAFLQGDGSHMPPPQRPEYQNNQVQPPPGVLRRNRPGRDLRVRFADQVGPPPGRRLRRRPRFNNLIGSYQADPDDDLAL